MAINSSFANKEVTRLTFKAIAAVAGVDNDGMLVD
jgi:hypothetical protein